MAEKKRSWNIRNTPSVLMRFSCRYWGREDYHERGTSLNMLELPNGQRLDLMAARYQMADLVMSFGIVIKHESVRNDDIEDVTVKVEILDPEKAFPLRLGWVEADIYSGKSAGTSGSSEGYISTYSLNGGQVEEYVERGQFWR